MQHADNTQFDALGKSIELILVPTVQFKRFFYYISLLLLIGSLIIPVRADSQLFTSEEQTWIKAHPVVKYGAESDWAPYYFINQQGQYQGITKDYLDLIGKLSNLTFEPTIDNWSVLLKKAKDQEIDMLAAIYSSKERETYLAFTSPYQTMTDYFFVRDDFDGINLLDLDGKTLAIPKGYNQIDTIKLKFPKIKIIETENLFSAVQAVVEKKADILLDSYSVVNYLLRKRAITTIRPFKAFSGSITNKLHMATSINNGILRSILNKSLAVISEKQKREITDKWLTALPASIANSISLSDEEISWLGEHSSLRVGVEYKWPPYEYVNQSGQLQGFNIEVLKLVERQLGIKFDYVSQYNWADTLDKVKNREIDLISGITSTPERRVYLDFSEPYFSAPRVLFVRKDDSTIFNMADLEQKTISIENQFALHESFIRDYPKISLLAVESTAEALKALSYGDVDAYIGDQGATNWIAEQFALANLKEVGDVAELGRANISIGVRKDWPILHQILNKALISIPNEDILALRRKWLGITVEEKGLGFSQEEQRWLNEHPKIRFTGNPNWLPYEAFDTQGNHIGIVALYLDLIATRLGIELEIVPSKTWQTATEKIKNNEVDIISETINSDLQSSFTFTQAYLTSPIVIVMNNKENYVENIDQIKEKRIAIIRDYGYVSQIIKDYPYIEFIYFNSLQEGLSAVSTGNVDALLATLSHVSYLTSELGLDNVRIVGKTEFSTQLAFGMRNEFAPLVPMFNRALDDITQVEKQSILNAWGKQYYIEKTDYLLLFLIAGILLAIIMAFVYWNRRLSNEIQQRKRAEAQIQALIDNMPLEIVVTAADGSILTANPQALEDYNIEKEAMQGFNISEFYADQAVHEEIKNEIKEHGQISQKIVHFKRMKTKLRSMMISIMPIEYNNQIAFLTIAVDMTERLEIENKLNEAKELAESASKAKSEFLSNMSHEIRTPMNAIMGFTELIKEQVTEPKLKSFAGIIHTAGNNLLSLINDILDLSKIEAGKFKIEKTNCNLHILFTEIGNIFMMELQEKSIDFILDIDTNIPTNLSIDAIRLRQVLFNLIGNAVKFTEQGHIRVKVYTDNHDDLNSKLDLIIEVEDSGLGISDDQQHVIFEDFEQSKGQDYNQYGGTGLGLSICKNLVTMMGGTITLTSKIGVGSTFVVKICNVDVLTVVDEAAGELLYEATTEVLLPCKILVVDDVEDNRALLVAYFANTNAHVVEAENGLQAVELAQEHFDLILMDIRMPVKDGYQAAREIKVFSSTPIVALTASVMTSEFEQLQGDNFAGYLRKPIHRTALFAELKKHLPFEGTSNNDSLSPFTLVDEVDYEHLPLALSGLEPLLAQYEMCCKHNDIAEAKLFSEALLQLMLEHPISAISDYAKRLNDSIDRFDIAAIEKHLREYPNLVEQLKKRVLPSQE